MKKKKPLYIGLAVGLVIGFLAYQAIITQNPSDPAYVGTGNYGAGAPPANSTAPTNSANSPSARLASDFTLPTLGGETITLSDYRGNKPVVLDFWASWCHNCQRAMPKLSKLYDQYKAEVEVIGINLREQASAVNNFVNSRGISYPIVLDSGSTARDYGINYTNTHILIDKQGKILQIIPGDLSERDLENLIRQS